MTSPQFKWNIVARWFDDLFFLPTGLGDYFQDLPLSYWKDLDQEIEKVIQRNYTPEIVQKSKTQLVERFKDLLEIE